MPTKTPKSKPAKSWTPEKLRKEINKRFGEGTVVTGSHPDLVITRIGTGVLSLDTLLGGGLPRGRYTELYGPYSAGKTYVAQRVMAEVQAQGGRAGFVDAEGTFDPAFAQHIGVNTDEMEYHRQVHGNRCVDIIESWLYSELYDVIVLDSIAALLPKAEQDSEMSAATMGTAQAKLMSAALRKLTAANRRTALVFINQTRESVGQVFVKRDVTSGGRAMGFYAGIRLEFVKTEIIKKPRKYIDPSSGEEKSRDMPVAHRVVVRTDKDKTGSTRTPYAQTTFVFDYRRKEIDPIEDLLYLGREARLIRKNASVWWVRGYKDEKVLGRENFKRWLRENRAVAEELEESLRDHDWSERDDD